MREIICRAGRAKASCRPTRRSESYAHPHLRTQHATTDDLQSPNIVVASIEVEHRALVRGARTVGLRLTSIRPACVRQGKHHRRPPPTLSVNALIVYLRRDELVTLAINAQSGQRQYPS